MIFRMFAAGALPLVLVACAAQEPTPLPDTAALIAAAEPVAAERPGGYIHPIRNYTARPVTDPGDWRTSNRSQGGL